MIAFNTIIFRRYCYSKIILEYDYQQLKQATIMLFTSGKRISNVDFPL